MTACLVHVTYDDETAALEVARDLVEQRLAACVHIEAPVQSVYRWKDAVVEGREYKLIAKTSESRVKALMSAVRHRHPNEVPALYALRLDPALVDPPFQAWLEAETRATGGR